MLFFICKNVYSASSLFFLDNRQTFFRKLCKLREKILSTKFATNQSFYGTSLKQIFFIFYRKIILWVTCIFYQTRFSTFYIFYYISYNLKLDVITSKLFYPAKYNQYSYSKNFILLWSMISSWILLVFWNRKIRRR